MYNKGRKFPAEILTHDEVQRMLDVCGSSRRRHRKSPRALRNKAFIVLIWRAMLRVNEALSLYPKDVDLDRGIIRVLHGKGNKARTVGIDTKSCEVIRDWMEAREELLEEPGENNPLVCAITRKNRGCPLSDNAMRQALQTLRRKAGITKRVHPHGFRHTGAVELMQEGIEIGVISKQLGHGSIATTAIYLDHVSPLRVIDALRHRDW